MKTVPGTEVKWSDLVEALFNKEVLETLKSGQGKGQPILET